tara:strand:+ start:459 stop:662 length:204 start_codon:yes stop_codon:yes gene_type:complete
MRLKHRNTTIPTGDDMGRRIEVDEDYHNLIERDSHLLECLMYYGVDSWEEFDNALVLYEEEKEEEYE